MLKPANFSPSKQVCIYATSDSGCYLAFIQVRTLIINKEKFSAKKNWTPLPLKREPGVRFIKVNKRLELSEAFVLQRKTL